MAVKNGKLEAKFTVPSGTTIEMTDSGGTQNVTITAGEYYLSSPVTGGGDTLLEDLAAVLSAGGAGDTWTATLSAGEGGTGRVTIDNTTHNSWGISWTETADGTSLRDVLGFDSNLSGESTAQTGADHAKHLWLPDGPILSQFGDDIPLRESDARTTISPAGHIKSLYGQRRAVYNVRWTVTRGKTFALEEVLTNESYETFWIDSVLGESDFGGLNGPVRLHFDADDDATFNTCQYQAFDVFEPRQIDAQWTGLYSVEVNRLIEVPS